MRVIGSYNITEADPDTAADPDKADMAADLYILQDSDPVRITSDEGRKISENSSTVPVHVQYFFKHTNIFLHYVVRNYKIPIWLM